MATPGNDINTGDFSTSTKNLYYNIIKLLNRLIVSIRKNLLLLILCIAIGCVPFLVQYITNSNNYKASFTVAYDEVGRKIYGDRIEKINSLVQRGEYQKVANALGVKLSLCEALISVEGTNILGEDLSKDLNTDRIPFIVNIVVKDSTAITPIQNGLLNFLETGNEFMATRKKIKLLENMEELSYIDREMKVIDSLIKNENIGSHEIPKTNTNTKNTGSLFEFSYELYKRKQELLRKERMPSSLLIVDDAIVYVEAKRPLALVLVLGFATGFILYIMLIAFIIPAFKFKE